MKYRFAVGCFLLPSLLFAQEKKMGSWQTINAELKLNKHWGLYAELQSRSDQLFNHYYYYEAKGGISYTPVRNVTFLLGMGRYATYAGKGNFILPFESEEFRIWQQVNLYQYVDRIKIEHRYRGEQKWVNSRYRNRFRYRINLTVPVNKAELTAGAFYLNMHNEIFLNNKSPHFERNRFFAGAGYHFSPVTAVQAGYVNQYNYSLTGHNSKNFLQLSLLLELELKP